MLRLSRSLIACCTTIRRASTSPSVVLTGFLLLAAALLSPAAATAGRYWIMFTDKGPAPVSSFLRPGSTADRDASDRLDPRCFRRRQKVLPADELTGDADAPLYGPYIRNITGLGASVVHESRWLNAVSVECSGETLEAVRKLPFVASTEPVRRAKRILPPESALLPEFPYRTASADALDYGLSHWQCAVINVPRLHELGVNGYGVLVGLLDTGFRWRAHEALVHTRVIAEHDFIHNRDVTSNQSDDNPGQDYHGTLTMSTLGGFSPGALIGPAYGASYLLAKTELIYPSYTSDTDSLSEEDHWVAGLEWLESKGADVVSSSLGYNDFVDAHAYTWAHGDFNGRTTPSARAAVQAARFGVLVCNAMGNEGNGDGRAGTLITPADADSIISVGAMAYDSTLAYFSSTGPTNDNRFKPDVIAPGQAVYCAVPPGPSTYTYQQGTSLATPLTAGTAALILSVRPELTPIQVRDTLRHFAHAVTDTIQYPLSPNNFTGWGLIDAFRTVAGLGVVFGNRPSITTADSQSVVAITVFSARGLRPDEVKLSYTAGDSVAPGEITMTLDSSIFAPTSGRYRAVIPRMPAGTPVSFRIQAGDSAGNSYQSPSAARQSSWTFLYGTAGQGELPETPQAYVLRQNYPNPFNSGTTIQYDLSAPAAVRLVVYNILGETITTLVTGLQGAGSKTVRWHADRFASGVYFCRLEVTPPGARQPAYTAVKKMLLLR